MKLREAEEERMAAKERAAIEVVSRRICFVLFFTPCARIQANVELDQRESAIAIVIIILLTGY